MDAEIELEEHNRRNASIIARLLGKKLTDEELALLARLKTQVIRSFTYHGPGAKRRQVAEAQHEAAELLAGELAPELALANLDHMVATRETIG